MKNRTLAILIFLVAFSFFFYYQRLHPLFGDEFNILVQAKRVLNGEVPYRDFFQFITPGSIYISALWLKLFGHDINSIKLFSALESSLIALLICLNYEIVVSSGIIRSIIFLLTLCYVTTYWPFISHHWLSTILALLVLYLELLYLKHARRVFLFLSGFVAGLTFLTLQNKGILTFIAVLALPVFEILSFKKSPNDFIKKMLLIMAGFALPVFVFMVYLWSKGALWEFIYDAFIWVLGPYRNFNAYPNYFFIGNYSIYMTFTENRFPLNLIRIRDIAFVGYLPPVIVALSAFHGYQVLKEHNSGEQLPASLPVVIMGVLMFVSVLYRSDIVHITFAMPFILLSMGFVLKRWKESLNFMSITKRRFFILLIVILLFHGAYGSVSRVRFASNFKYPYHTKIGTLYAAEKEVADFYNELFSAIEENVKSSSIFVYLWSSFVYYITGKKNPTRYDSAIPGYNTDEQLTEIVMSLEKSGVEFIFYDNIDRGIAQDPFAYSYPLAIVNLDNPITRYMKEHFEMVYELRFDENTQPCSIWRRKNSGNRGKN